MTTFHINDIVLWHDPWRKDWGVPMDTREWTVFDFREDMVCICTGDFGSNGYAEAEVPPQELELVWTARIKAIAKNVAICAARVVWAVGYFLVCGYALYVTSVVLSVCIPDGTSVWVRLVIGMPILAGVTLSVALLYIELSRFFDGFSGYRLLHLRPLNGKNPSAAFKRMLYYRLAQLRRWVNTPNGERVVIRTLSTMAVLLAIDVVVFFIGCII